MLSINNVLKCNFFLLFLNSNNKVYCMYWWPAMAGVCSIIWGLDFDYISPECASLFLSKSFSISMESSDLSQFWISVYETQHLSRIFVCRFRKKRRGTSVNQVEVQPKTLFLLDRFAHIEKRTRFVRNCSFRT